MKKSLTQALGFCAALLMVVTACKKDEVQTVIQPGPAITLTPSASTFTLLQTNSSATAATYTWSAASFGYQAAVTYSVQFDKKGGDFSSPVSFDAGTSLSKVLSVADLNSAFQSKGLVSATAAPVPTQMDVRVVASVGAAAPKVMSAVSTFTATPYSFCEQPAANKSWSLIGTVGPGTDWSTDYVMTYDCVSKKSSYTGALKVGEYKFRYGADWTANLGGTSSTGGALTQNGDNLKITVAKTYTIVLTPSTIGSNGQVTAGSTFTIQ